jgi:hypothetical protein
MMKEIELYNQYGDVASLDEVCRWWEIVYPEDVFKKEPKDIVAIRKHMRAIRKLMERNK